MSKSTRYVATQDAVNAFADVAAKAPWLSIDTEFERIRTYYPKLCLVQIGAPGESVCIDPLADISLDPLREAIAESPAVKIFHAARQDLEVLHHALALVPNHLFDTQIAAAMTGYGDQMGYAHLVKTICGVELSKAYTRTSWCRRPLTDQEILYAFDDVEYLDTICDQLRHELESKDRLGWHAEDCAALLSGEWMDAENAGIEKVAKACSGLGQEAQSVAHALAVWREETAQRRDRPREWLLATTAIVALAERRPASLSELAKVADIEPGTVKHRGDEILEVIKEGKKNADGFIARKPPTRPDEKTKALGNALWDTLNRLCAEAEIPTSCVAKRDDIRALAAGRRDLRLLTGWRRDFAGEKLEKIATETA